MADPAVDKPRKKLEEYEPGASREEVHQALRKAIQTPKKPAEPPAQASSKTSADHRADAST
jgi:hypothetical protein